MTEPPKSARELISHGRALITRLEAAAARLHELGGQRTAAGASLEKTARTVATQLDGVELSFSRMAVAGSLKAWESSPEGQRALAGLAQSLSRHEQDVTALEKLLTGG